MTITVKLFATLKQYGSEIQEITVPEGTTVADVIKMLKIPESVPLLRIVNAVHVKPDYKLKDGDTLALFPPIAGGQ
ncbi:MAG: MoaD/ThiS family protein [Nitrospirae bacterium]|nr:MoaD/ThiS family protein [Nitrospirota bacterium]